MSEENLVTVIVSGFGLTALLGYFASRVRRPHDEDNDTDSADGGDGEPRADHRSSRLRTALIVAAVLLGLATAVFWLVAAVGIAGALEILAIFVGAPLAALVIGVVLSSSDTLLEHGAEGALWLLAGIVLLASAGTLFNGFSYFTGMAREVDFHVTASAVADQNSSSVVAGRYVSEGTTHTVRVHYWYSREGKPETGTTVKPSIAPLWPHPFMPDEIGAGVQLTFATVLGVPGWFLTRAAASRRHQRKRLTTEKGRDQ